MTNQPLVSVIIPFYNTSPVFMNEAIESVLKQDYKNWEILLIDDGSDVECSSVAINRAKQYPEKIRYLEHPEHQNRGISASRQLGVDHAEGDYFAFLDADDVWLPEKLEKQVALLEANPEAGMVYSSSLYWYSWNPTHKFHDYVPGSGIPSGSIIRPPHLLLLFLKGKAAIPSTCSILVRRELVFNTGGFVPEFRGLYEDQVFYAKVCLNAPVLVVDECWDYYRQHPESMTAMVLRVEQLYAAHVRYLKWLEDYVVKSRYQSKALVQAIKRELWLYQDINLLGIAIKNRPLLRWMKKWILRIEATILPTQIRSFLWSGK